VSNVRKPELLALIQGGAEAAVQQAAEATDKTELEPSLGVAFTETGAWFWIVQPQRGVYLIDEQDKLFETRAKQPFVCGRMALRSAPLNRPATNEIERVYVAPHRGWRYIPESLMVFKWAVPLDRQRLVQLLGARPSRTYRGDRAYFKFMTWQEWRTTEKKARQQVGESRCVALLTDRRVLFCRYKSNGLLLLQTEDGAACLLVYDQEPTP
jgi:hypothetical protein